MSIFDNKSGQHIGDGSCAIQVAGDFQIGNSSTEVIAICELVVKSQMASLREDAYKIVDERAREFGQQIAAKLSETVDQKVASKLADPDIQYSINQAVTQVARKGFDEKSELLKELIISKIEVDEEQESILIDQALDATPRLTTNEIKFLAWVYFLRSVTKIANGINITRLAEEKKTHFALTGFTLENNYKLHQDIYSDYNSDHIRFLGEHFTLKRLNMDMLDIKGVISSDKRYEVPYQELINKRTGFNGFASESSFFEVFPAIKLVLDSFGIKSLVELNSLVINPVGSMIAQNYLKARGFIM